MTQMPGQREHRLLLEGAWRRIHTISYILLLFALSACFFSVGLEGKGGERTNRQGNRGRLHRNSRHRVSPGLSQGAGMHHFKSQKVLSLTGAIGPTAEASLPGIFPAGDPLAQPLEVRCDTNTVLSFVLPRPPPVHD